MLENPTFFPQQQNTNNMRQYYLSFTLLFVLFSISLFAQRNCGTMEYLEMQQENDPERMERLKEIEQHTAKVLSNPTRSVNGTITIPVVVHVVYNTAQENISDAQIFSQIAILNEDFTRTNPDAGDTPADFLSVAADSEIEFCLATVDPQGNPTNGITRTQTNQSSFSTNNSVKFDASGGKDAWPAGDYLNIWVCDISGGILGYAQFPGGPASTDGIVCDYLYFGDIGTATPPYDLGRTATHEVGHWLNLRHIWGDGGCGVDDFVADTPLAGGPNFNGFPCTYPGPNSCNTGSGDLPDMFQNYMDYSDDGCMNVFTLGQKARMRALFDTGGFRESILSSTACGSTPPGPTCTDGIQNGDETGVDCGGSNCPPCPPTCDDGIQNGDETGVDCGGSNCPACPPTCNDGIQNGDEEGVDCGGSNCDPCPCAENGLTLTIEFDLFPQQVTWDLVNSNGQVVASGGPYPSSLGGDTVTEELCLPDDCYDFTMYDSGNNGLCCRFGQGFYQLVEDASGAVLAQGANYFASETTEVCLGGGPPAPTCTDGIQNGDEEGVDCGGSNCPPCQVDPSCNDGIQNGDEEGIDCGGSNCPPCQVTPTCTDGIQNGDEEGVDCGGTNCPPCATCTDGIQNGNETGVDCGGPDCPACPTCNDGIQNGDEEGVDCGGSNCPACPSCNDGIQNGNETDVDCGGPDCAPCTSCTDGIQNGFETGVDCGGPACVPCGTGCDVNVDLLIQLDGFPQQTTWEIVDVAGNVYGSGGPYASSQRYEEVTEQVCLPAGCFSFIIYDSGNNGICCRFGQGFYELTDDAGNTLATGGEFDAQESTSFCVGGGLPAPRLSTPASQDIQLFPNPTKGQVTILFDQEVPAATPLRIFNLMGEEVFRTQLRQGERTRVLQTENFSAGVYLVEVRIDGSVMSKRLVVAK
jgi:hypothetical protein